MDLESFIQTFREMNEAYRPLMQTLESNEEPSMGDSIGEMNSYADNAWANLVPMIQQIIEQEAVINQMFAERLS